MKTINNKKVKLLIREGEGLTVEFKQKYSSRIDEDIVAFANTKGGTLLLGVRDDGSVVGERLTNIFKNPGGLFGGMPKKALGTMSARRNELVSDLFSRIHKVERVGMGIKRMKRVLREAGLKEPEFETNGFFRAVIHRSPEFAMKGMGRRTESRPELLEGRMMQQVGTKLALSRHQVEILGKCYEDSSLVDLMAITGRSDRTKFRNGIIKPLIEAGLLELTIPDKPRSRMQRYRTTAAGKAMLKGMGN